MAESVKSKKSSSSASKKSKKEIGIGEAIAYPVTHVDKDENEERGNWANPAEFILASLGYAVGLGNVWRFPYVVYEFGGGTFLFVYWLLFFLVAYPIFFMELSLGQFSSSGPIGLCPALEGVGYATVSSTVLAAIYYNGIFTWALFYTGASMQKTMPWDTCSNKWNSKVCFTIREYQECVGEEPSLNWYMKTKCYNEWSIDDFFVHLDTCIMDSKTPELPPNCTVKLDFDFNKTVANFSVDQMLKRQIIQQNNTMRLFLIFDDCTGSWKHSDTALEALEHKKLRLDLVHKAKGDKDGLKKEEIHQNLKDLINKGTLKKTPF